MTTYCTTQDVATFLGGATPVNDPALAPIVTNTNQAIDTYLSRNILAADYTETYKGNGSRAFMVNNTPINSVASLSILGQVVPPTTTPLVPGFLYQADLGLFEVYGYGPIPAWMGAIAIAYNAGYASVPADLAQAAIEWAAFKYKTRQNIGVQTKSLDRETITYSQHAMPLSVKAILDIYRPNRIY